MRNKMLPVLCMLAPAFVSAQVASLSFEPVKTTDNTRSLYFNTSAPGERLPILWGLDTAWPDEGNIRRGVSYMGSDIIGVVRVSFQLFDFLQDTHELTERLLANLKERLRLVRLVNGPGKVKIALNNDGPAELVDKRYLNAAQNRDAAKAYANLIYGTMKACEDLGWEVVSVAPLNEPDYIWNGQGSKDDFLAIARELKENYAEFREGKVRISGGNTLNCDEALPWYEHLYDWIDEGNTHQLAGSFNTYASFFERVRQDGKYATADELHNVMEAMVGVEYGMQTGIWWGTAELARGEFCKASSGERLSYAENRKAWTAASVYRSPDGKIQAFCGTSERQATPSEYRFVSLDRDVFFDGHGPRREYLVALPGGAEGSYQDGQTNAECVVDITWGEDVRPVVDGDYRIMNAYSKKVMGYAGAATNFAGIEQQTVSDSGSSLWTVKPTVNTIGGDFSYYTICAASAGNMKLDVLNWSLDEQGSIILYDGATGNNEQWYLKYAGDGYFRILSRHSNLCLEIAEDSQSDGVRVHQAAVSDSPRQLWRFIDVDAECETEAPAAPGKIDAESRSASVALSWVPSVSADVATYTVLRAEKGSDEFNVIGRGVKTNTFVDNTALKGVDYRYKMKAVDRSGNTSDCGPIAEGMVGCQRCMVAYYPFDNTLEDSTENGFTAMSQSKIQYIANSNAHEKGNPCMRMRALQSVQIPYGAVHSDEITVAMWVKWTSGECAFDFGSGSDNSFSLTKRDGKIIAGLTIAGLSERAEADDPGAEWMRVAVVCGGGRLALYINGEEAASANITNRYSDLNPIVNIIGRNQERTGSTFASYMDDLSIYNYALSPDEIKSETGNPSGVNDAFASQEIVGREYYNLAGQKLNGDSLPAGVYVVREIHADGSVTATKKIVR